MSVAIGVLGAVGFAVSGWALQAAALPAPRSADRVLADASAWFHEYRFAVDLVHASDRRLGAACLRGTVRLHRRRRPGAILSLRGHGVALVSARGRVIVLSGSQPRSVPFRLAADAACTGALELELVRAAQTGDRISVERAYAAHQPAVALEIQRGGRGSLTLYVSPRTYRPLVALVHARRLTVKARLYLQPIAGSTLRRFQLPIPGAA